MVKAELIKRSPLRILEKSIHGGLTPGHLGIIAAHKGEGKTACVVHLATDKLLQGKHVIHVSFETKTNHILDWYESIFKEIAVKRELEGAVEIHDEIIKNRVVLNFHQHTATSEQIKTSVDALMSQGGFAAEILVIDGYDFTHDDKSLLVDLKAYAAEKNLALWATADVETGDAGFPQELNSIEELTSVLIELKPQGDHTKLTLIKDYDRLVNEELHLILEPKTLLIAEE